jgi:hypothetical protein
MISIEYAHKVFDLWIDKTSSPYLTSDEKDIFINRGITEFVNDHFDTKNPHRPEATIRDAEELTELIEPVTGVQTNAQGRLSTPDIEAALGGREYDYLLSASRASSLECGGDQRKSRYVRHNDWLAQKDNTYKKPTEMYPTHRVFNGYLQFNPVGVSNVELVVIKKHVEVTLDDPTSSGTAGPAAVDIELSDAHANRIIFLALRQAGISIREGEFYQMVANEINENE